ncbi:response regulator transcription factor [Streptomyces sp. NPDC014724]|uniref:response regulator transcription factor n=1 Tax=unclassified Streptomyces TaxID=2593676 RepID=UPI0036FD137B
MASQPSDGRIALRLPVRPLARAGALVTVPLVVGSVRFPHSWDLLCVPHLWAFALAALLGIVVRTRKEYTEALVDRAQRLELERDQQARLAAAAGRTRIARGGPPADAGHSHDSGHGRLAGTAPTPPGRHPLVTTVLIADDQPMQRFSCAYDGLRAGASGFLTKDTLPEELLSGIRAVASGDAVVAPSLTRRLLDAYAHHLPAVPGGPTTLDARIASLTEREREILTVIGRGWTNAETADRLRLAESTVKTHVTRILAKTGSRDRVQAVILAYDTHLVTAG